MATPGFAPGELLVQGHPAVTTPVVAYKASVRTEITLMLTVAIGNNVDILIYHDDTGADNYTDNNLIANGNKISGGTSEAFQAEGGPGTGIMIKKGGSLGIQISVADAVTFSIYGVTEDVAPATRR